MLDIVLVAIGKMKSSACQQLADDYSRRLDVVAKLRIVQLPGGKFVAGQAANARRDDSLRVAKFLAGYPDKKVFLLTEFGPELDSVAWAKMLDDWDRANCQVVLVIGGAPGLDPEIIKPAAGLSLSKLTWPHELARVLLLEQLYRGLAINKGKDYHY